MKGNYCALVKGEEGKIPGTERLCRFHREERGRSGRDEQRTSDILFVHPRPPFALQFILRASQG